MSARHKRKPIYYCLLILTIWLRQRRMVDSKLLELHWKETIRRTPAKIKHFLLDYTVMPFLSPELVFSLPTIHFFTFLSQNQKSKTKVKTLEPHSNLEIAFNNHILHISSCKTTQRLQNHIYVKQFIILFRNKSINVQINSWLETIFQVTIYGPKYIWSRHDNFPLMVLLLSWSYFSQSTEKLLFEEGAKGNFLWWFWCRRTSRLWINNWYDNCSIYVHCKTKF